jgi:hypothetical protein
LGSLDENRRAVEVPPTLATPSGVRIDKNRGGWFLSRSASPGEARIDKNGMGVITGKAGPASVFTQATSRL